jgi:hypothetical protein
MGASMSHKPIGLTDCYRESFSFHTFPHFPITVLWSAPNANAGRTIVRAMPLNKKEKSKNENALKRIRRKRKGRRGKEGGKLVQD